RLWFFFFQAEDGIRDRTVTGVQTCALPILIEDGLRVVVNHTTKAKSKRRVVLPVSKATGGPRPGFEFIRLSDIDAIEDADYVERSEERRVGKEGRSRRRRMDEREKAGRGDV